MWAPDGYYLEGQIDALADDGSGTALIVDYKTGGFSRETGDELIGKHLLQARSYAYALLREGIDASMRVLCGSSMAARSRMSPRWYRMRSTSPSWTSLNASCSRRADRDAVGILALTRCFKVMDCREFIENPLHAWGSVPQDAVDGRAYAREVRRLGAERVDSRDGNNVGDLAMGYFGPFVEIPLILRISREWRRTR